MYLNALSLCFNMDKGIKEMIERNKIKAEQFLKEDIRVFIKDVQDNYYFCDILIVGEVNLLVYNFAGKREGEKSRLNWADIIELKEYEVRE